MVRGDVDPTERPFPEQELEDVVLETVVAGQT
jgi:hypothetical protein